MGQYIAGSYSQVLYRRELQNSSSSTPSGECDCSASKHTVTVFQS